MIKVCSAAANKILRKLTDEKDILLSTEGQRNTYSVLLSEEKDNSAIIPEYNFVETQNKLEEVEDKILKIKHALNKFNAETEIMPGMTIDMALVKMAMLSKRQATLRRMQSIQKVTTTTSMMRGEAYRTYANFETEDVAKKYEEIGKELTDLQLALDRVNLTEMFEIDIEE